MIVPLIALFAVVSLLFLAEQKNESPNSIILFLIITSMVLICTFRDVAMADAESYIYDFYSAEEGGGGRIRIGYALLRDFTRIISDDYKALFLVVSTVAITIKILAFKNISAYVYGSILVYISYFFVLHEMIQIRAGLASGVSLFAIKYLSERDIKKFLISCTIAICFHTTAFIILPLWFLSTHKFNRLVWGAVIPICYLFAAIGFTLGNFISYIPIDLIQSLFWAYQMAMNQGRHDFINIFNLLLLIKITTCTILIINQKTIKKYFPTIDIWLKIYTISLAIYIIFSDMPVAAIRLSQFLQITEIILIPAIIYTANNKIVGKLYVITISTLFLISVVFFSKYLSS